MINGLRLLVIFLSLYANSVWAIEITHVYHQPEIFNPTKNEHVEIHFNLSDQSDVTIKIYDDRDLLIKKIQKSNVSDGEHTLDWNGKDHLNRNVPAEAYRYTIEAKGKDGKLVEHDLSDHTGGDRFNINDINWDSKKKQFEYTLKQPARILLRIGLKNDGPLLANIMNWLPRAAGKHTEKWNGMDASEVIELSQHPKMEIDIQAYSLSNNTILVDTEPTKVRFVDIKWSQEKRQHKKVQNKRMIAAQQQAPETRGDYLVALVLPDKLPKTKKGVPVVSGELPVMLTIDQSKMAIAIDRRAEPVFFIDGQFAFENEVGFLPMTWLLNTNKLNEGEHYLSVNLRGYEGNFGLATIKIHVRRSDKKASK